MSRQQKRHQREKEILAATIKLLEEHSFIDLRMSDIAKAANCSMGAIYSHFSSKEDLLLGCATAIHRFRMPMKEHIKQLDLEPYEKIILVSFCLWVINEHFPNHYRLEHLAMNPWVWERASTQRSQSLNQYADEMYDWMQSISREVLKDIHPQASMDDKTLEFELGIFSSCLGMQQIKESGISIFEPVFANRGDIEKYINLLKRFFNSWHISLLDDRLDELLKMAEAIVKEKLQSQSYSEALAKITTQ